MQFMYLSLDIEAGDNKVIHYEVKNIFKIKLNYNSAMHVQYSLDDVKIY